MVNLSNILSLERNNGEIVWLCFDTLAKLGFVAYLACGILNKILVRGTKIDGALVLITGASQGIGANLAEQMIKKGAKVALLARGKPALETLQEKLNSIKPNAVFIFPTDCSSPEQVEQTASKVEKTLGTPDIIINCAGAGRWRFLHEMSGDEVKSCMDAPYFSAALVTRAFLNNFVRRNTGAIVNINSPAGLSCVPGATAYSTARWALHGFSEILRSDLKSTGIKVQEVVLGETHSEYFTNNPGSHERIPKITALVPVLSPADAASCIIHSIKSGSEFSTYPFLLTILQSFNYWMPNPVKWLCILTGWSLQKSGLDQSSLLKLKAE